MGRACSMYGKNELCMYDMVFVRRPEVVVVDRRRILKLLIKK
jgi:hypothetical protein